MDSSHPCPAYVLFWSRYLQPKLSKKFWLLLRAGVAQSILFIISLKFSPLFIARN